MKLVNILTIFLVILMTVSTPAAYAAGGLVPALDVTDVLTDLGGMSIDGDSFNQNDYPLCDGGDPELLGVYEYGYGTDDYALYIYVYHPDAANTKHTYNYGDIFGSLWTWSDTLDSAEYKYDIASMSPEIVDHTDDHRIFKLKLDVCVLILSYYNRRAVLPEHEIILIGVTEKIFLDSEVQIRIVGF